jgi:hypothetical protein
MGKHIVASAVNPSTDGMGSGLEMALKAGIIAAEDLGSGSFDEY